MTNHQSLHSITIPERPNKRGPLTLNAIGFIVIFNVSCFLIHVLQLTLLLPLRALPFSWTRHAYSVGMRRTKGWFGVALLLMCQWFAPTNLSITFETEGQGRFTPEQIEGLVCRDATGRVTEIRLPNKYIMIANHQVYADWWYLWCLTYFLGTYEDVFIVLKKSLKWVPVAGWAMQIFDFIFLARNWAVDRLQLAKQLSHLGAKADSANSPLCLMLFPEGTLVSELTRPISQNYAEKVGIPDMENLLLPRSTGLLYSLRALLPHVPDLHLLDVTIVYPGVPTRGYGQSFYTLRSIFFECVPPPQINMHLRMWKVSTEVPIGDLYGIKPSRISEKEVKPIELDFLEAEREFFDRWLTQLWREKDEVVSKFVASGKFDGAGKMLALDVPLVLRHQREIFSAFAFFVPVICLGLWLNYM